MPMNHNLFKDQENMEPLKKNLDKLKNEIINIKQNRTINFFDITLISDREISHSAFLAWLLNPKENHGLNDLFLKYILKKLKFNEEYKINDVIVETEITKLRRRIDIIINIKDIKICIENKIWDYPTKEQIENEIEEFEPDYMILLAPKQIIKTFQDENNIDNIHYIDYNYIYNSIKRLINVTNDESLNILLKNYNINLEEKILTNKYSLFSKKALLYKKYQEYIEEVRKNYNSERNEIKKSIQNKIKKYSPNLDKYGFTENDDLYIQNTEWNDIEFDIYIVINLDIDNLKNNMSLISIKMGKITKERSQKIRNIFIKKLGNILEKNNYIKTNDKYKVYVKQFNFNNFVEDALKEIKFLIDSNFNDVILECIKKTHE